LTTSAGQLKAKLAKLKRELLTPSSGGGGGGGGKYLFKGVKELCGC
jgi:ribosome-interacting GTPase 1